MKLNEKIKELKPEIYGAMYHQGFRDARKRAAKLAEEHESAQPDYNDGNWHGWNGGECQVHPKSWVGRLDEFGDRKNLIAADVPWQEFHGAFCVIKVYAGPREFWIVAKSAYTDYKEASHAAEDLGIPKSSIIHVQEIDQ